MLRSFTVIMMLSLMASLVFAADIPDWVKKRPISEDNFIGIGISMKSKQNKNYMQIAKDNALKDLSSGIQVSVNSEVLSKVIEKSGIVKEEIISQIRTNTEAKLTNYKLVDTYENKTEYWVYYALSKAVYARQMLETRSKAMDLSLDLFMKGNNSLSEGDITQALRLYFQAIRPIEEYFGEPLDTIFEGKLIYLGNEVYSSIQNSISKIQLVNDKKTWSARIGLAVSPIPTISALYSNNSTSIPIRNLPLINTLGKGSFDFIPEATSDENGKVLIHINKVNSDESTQILKTALDISKIANPDSNSVIFKAILKTLPIPEQAIYLSVSPLIICIHSDEYMFGRKLTLPCIEPKLKDMLAADGYHFTDAENDADYMMNISSNAREGSEIKPTPTNSMYVAFVDMNISLMDLHSGQEIYKNSLSNVKGINLDMPKAGMKAYENAVEMMKQNIMDEIREKLKK